MLHFDDLPRGTIPYQASGPPIWLGGATPAALARTGRLYDGWLPYPPDPADYAAGLATVRLAASAAGRSLDAVTPALFVTVLIAPDVEAGRRALAQYSRVNYGVPLEVLETIQVLMTGPRDHVAAELRRYIAAGARHIVCRIGAFGFESQQDQAEQMIDLPLE